MTQDDQGFLWFASLYGGMARYDGYEFKIYHHDPEDANSLPTNEVHAVYSDPQGGIWAGTNNGLIRLDTQTEQLTVYEHDPENPESLSHSNVTPILRDSDGVLWVGTEKGISRLIPGMDRFIRYPLTFEDTDREITAPVQWVWCLFEDSSGTLWVGTLGGGLLRYDRTSDTFKRFLHDPDDPTSLPHDFTHAITEDANGDLWVGTSDGLARMVDRERGKFEIYQIRSMFPGKLYFHVADIFEDRLGNLWVSIGEAAMVRPAGEDDFQLIEHDPGTQGSLGKGRVWKIFEDQAGVLWILSDVISRLVPTVHAFSIIPGDIPIPDSVSFTLDSQGRFWVGGVDGLYGYDPRSAEWTRHQPFPDAENTINKIHGFGIYEDPEGTLWVATESHLSRFDPDAGLFEPVELSSFLNCIIKGSDGLLWAGQAFSGLISYDFDNAQLEVYSHDESDPTSVSHDFGYVVQEDKAGRLWFGTHDGLNLFDRSSGTSTRFLNEPGNANSLSNSSIRGIIEDETGRLWVATQFGLNLWDEESAGFTRYFNGKEAPDNMISSIVSFGDGFLWLATDRGIAKFDTEKRQFTNYSYEDGLPLNFFPVLQAGAHGELYGLTSGGILKIDTGRLELTSQPPPVSLTQFRLFNQPVDVSTSSVPTVLQANINQTNHMELNHSDQVFSIGFSALDFREPGRNLYQYKLEGLNNQWIDTDASNRLATFTDLAPGSYTFRVRAANRDGVWNETGVSLGITVLPPLWRTGWAYSLYALIFTLLLTAFISWRTRLLRIRAGQLEMAVEERTQQLIESEHTVRDQAERLQELLELKERLFSNISHEFRTPLTLMLGPINNAVKEVQNPKVVSQLKMARRNGKRVLRLVDQLLELSKLSSDEPVKLSPQPLKPIVEMVCDAFRSHAHDKGITLSVMTDAKLWVDCAPEAIERILMNLVSNALKFTPSGGRVNVVLREHEGLDSSPGEVELQVFDTGKGIPRDQQEKIFERFKRADGIGENIPGSGIGLALVRELVETHHGRITLESEPGKGTVVTVLLPVYEVPPGVELVSDSIASEALRLEVETLEQPQELYSADSDETGSEKPRLLVIEDNRDMQYYLQQLLSSLYTVELAGDGESGLAHAQAEIPDLIICDLMLPKQSGYEVSHELKSDDRTSHIPIIILTARSDEDSRLEGLREHVDDFLTKPFNDEELMLRIANLLAIRDILKARYSGQLNSGRDPRPNLSEPERRFLDRLESVLDANYHNQEFSVTDMATAMALSVRQLQRKLKALTDQHPGHYLRIYRMNRALDLLKQGKLVGDTAYTVGFGSPAHFSSCFRAQYGCTPTEYQNELAGFQQG